ncbi:phenoloxidase-activating factor 2 [Anabrus simplex]|uniref:phenoloxidase-activating factor 2 n=1 Tax=Anabrus simplex TaxID=316456 RepID=UPI0035A356B3
MRVIDFLLLLSVNEIVADPSSLRGCSCESIFHCLCVVKSACYSDGTINYTATGQIEWNFRPSVHEEVCGGVEACCQHTIGEEKTEITTSKRSSLVSTGRSLRIRSVCGVRGPRIREDLPDMETEYGEFPWTLALFALNGTRWWFLCGASLISRNMALTAAHCVDRFKDDLPSLKLRVGAWDLRNSSEGHQEVNIADLYLHSSFSRTRGRFDIALIRTATDLKPGKAVKTVCLPPHDMELPENSSCIVTGWGRETFGPIVKLRSRMKQVEQSLVIRKVCNKKLKKTVLGSSFRLRNDFICADGKTMADTCQVRAGSPLVCEYMGRYLQMGIASWNILCGEKLLPGVYVNVQRFSEWIRKTMKL